jgi:hypothetical protein
MFLRTKEFINEIFPFKNNIPIFHGLGSNSSFKKIPCFQCFVEIPRRIFIVIQGGPYLFLRGDMRMSKPEFSPWPAICDDIGIKPKNEGLQLVKYLIIVGTSYVIFPPWRDRNFDRVAILYFEV